MTETDRNWSRDEVIKFLKTYAGGADFSEKLTRKVCREAFKLLNRERGAENIHFAPKQKPTRAYGNTIDVQLE